MIRKYKIIASFLLLVVFLMPSIVKIEHHHTHGGPADNIECTPQEYHDICIICNFEFFVFLSEEEAINFEKEDHSKYLISDHFSAHFQNLPHFNFLLRAPPSFHI